MREIRNDQLQVSAFHEQLPNGLDVYVIPKPGFQQTFAMFTTKYGSIDREFVVPGETEPTVVPDGIAHFLEHKMFEQPDGEDVFNVFANFAASPNAFTAFDITSYLFSCTDNVEENLNVLLNYVQEPYFTDENVEKEKGIIGQEIRMYDDNPGWQVYFNLLRALYEKHPIAIDIAGTVESISEITKETLYKCYNTFYHPSNMVLVVVGDVDPARLVQLAQENQGKKGYERQAAVVRRMPEEPRTVHEARVERPMTVSIPKVQFGYKDTASAGLSGREMLLNEYATAIGLDALIGKSSPLFNRLYEEGLVDKQFGWSYDVTPFYSHSVFGGNSKDPDRLLSDVQQAFADALEKGISEADFTRARNKMIGQVLSLIDSPRMLARYFTTYVTRDANVFDIIPILEGMTLEQVNARLREHLQPDYLAASIITPK